MAWCVAVGAVFELLMRVLTALSLSLRTLALPPPVNVHGLDDRQAVLTRPDTMRLHAVSCGTRQLHFGAAGTNGLAGRCLSLDIRR